MSRSRAYLQGHLIHSITAATTKVSKECREVKIRILVELESVLLEDEASDLP